MEISRNSQSAAAVLSNTTESVQCGHYLVRKESVHKLWQKLSKINQVMQHFLGQSLQLKETNKIFNEPSWFEQSTKLLGHIFRTNERIKGLPSVWSLSSCNKKFVLVFQMLNWLAGKNESKSLPGIVLVSDTMVRGAIWTIYIKALLFWGERVGWNQKRWKKLSSTVFKYS